MKNNSKIKCRTCGAAMQGIIDPHHYCKPKVIWRHKKSSCKKSKMFDNLL
jgi:hypothetical protein